MAELPRLIERTIDGVLEGLDASENRHLISHVKAIKQMAVSPGEDAEARLNTLLELLEGGWTPDFFAAAGVEVNGQLTMTTARRRETTVGGGLKFGPVSLEGSYTEEFSQGTTTNLSVRVSLVRQSRSKGLENAFSSLASLPAPA